MRRLYATRVCVGDGVPIYAGWYDSRLLDPTNRKYMIFLRTCTPEEYRRAVTRTQSTHSFDKSKFEFDYFNFNKIEE